MIKSSTQLSEYLKHTRDNSTANSDTGKLRIDHHYGFLLAESNNYIVERTKYGTAKDGQRSYLFPPDYIQMKTVRFQDSAGMWHPVGEIKSLDRWQQYANFTQEASVPLRWIVINEQGNTHLELDPIPDADGDENIEIVYEGYQDRLLFPADYTTGTITITNGSADVAGAGGATFTSAMIGRFLQATDGKYWYDIKSRTNSTAIKLVNFFQEADISASAYTIAEMCRLPQEYHYTPVWGAVWDYYMPNNKDKADEYRKRYLSELGALQKKYNQKTKGAVTPGRPVGGIQSSVPRNYPRSLLTRI